MLTRELEIPGTEHDPILGDGGYPTEAELERIRCWPMEGWAALMEYIRVRWKYADDGSWEQSDGEYRLHTVGWSGNESLVGALSGNLLFWSCCWVWSSRGGHHALDLSSWPESDAGASGGAVNHPSPQGEEDLAKDVLEIITVFSARLYGSRSRKNQKLLEGVKAAVEASQC